MEEICSNIKIKNVNEVDVPKFVINDAINKHHSEETREQVGKKLQESRMRKWKDPKNT